MEQTVSASGTCLCGHVRITANELELDISACHCHTCLKWSGGPDFAALARDGICIEGSEYVGIYTSSSRATRAFCKECGTHLYFHDTETGEHYLPVSLFDDVDPRTFTLVSELFIDKRPPYYALANPVKQVTAEEYDAEQIARCG